MSLPTVALPFLPGGQNAPTLAGVQKGFLDQETSEQGQWISESKQTASPTIKKLPYQGLPQGFFCSEKN